MAGGRGTRAGGGIPKQFRTLEDGRTVFETCVAAFEQNEHIDEIAVVMLEEYMQQAKDIAAKHTWTKLRYWIPGGSERWESTLHAVEAINGSINRPIVNLLIHDCARPFISQALITKVCEALDTHEAVSVAVPVTDTIYVVENSESETVISEVPSRAVFRRAQTPQAFRLSVLKEAFEKVKNGADCKATDDAGVVRYCLPDIPIHIVPGEESNRKLTFAEDF